MSEKPVDAMSFEEAMAALEQVVGARLAFLVGGGTGAGKTTVLNALLSLVDPRDRVVVVEDTAELAPDTGFTGGR